MSLKIKDMNGHDIDLMFLSDHSVEFETSTESSSFYLEADQIKKLHKILGDYIINNPLVFINL